MRPHAAPTWLVGLALLVGCDGPQSGDSPPEKRESPQASAEPAQLAVAPTTSAAPAPSPEGGAPPTALRGDEPLAAEALTRESVSGYTLSAALRPSDLTGPPRVPELSASGLDAARRATELRVTVDLAPARMRLALAGQGFVLPPGAEVRARADRYGHVLLWNGGASYRPLAPGSARALFGERRFDVAPIALADVTPREESTRRLGVRARRVDVETRAATASFEIGKLDGAGEGGVLLCRLLLDLMSAPPSTSVCGLDEVPLRAELRWKSQGALGFEITGAVRRAEIPAATLHVPPVSAAFTPASLPAAGVATMLDAHALTALRTSDADVPALPGLESDELVVSNATVELRVLFLDGVPVAWAAPGARGSVRGLRRGRYVAQWRTFLGDAIEPAAPLTVPGVAHVGPAPETDHE